MRIAARVIAGACALLLLAATPAVGQINMPDPKQISGVPLPTSDLPAGTVSVRVIRGSFANNLPGVGVDFIVDGKTVTVQTDAQGRAQRAGLAPGAHVKVTAVVGAERLESQDVTIGQTGIRFVLAATDPNAEARAAEDRQLAIGDATAGTVVLGPESRLVAEFSSDRLTLYYVIKILNTARTPVDVGGPLIFELPTGARGASTLQDSTKQARVIGPRIVVTGPFAPGTTDVDVAFELPYEGATAHVVQKWPATLQQLSVFVLKTGDLDVESAQFTSKQAMTQQGQPLVAGAVDTIPAGQTLTLDIIGLPHHARWPRVTALALAGVLVSIGVWAAVVTPRRRAA